MQILFEDENIIVVIKPVGIDSEKGVIDKLKEIKDGEFFTVHRLDKNVGGVMVYAKNKKTAGYLSKIIQQNEMIKEYVAVVHGKPPHSAVLEDYLFKDSKINKVFVVKSSRKGVKQAKLFYKVLKYYEDSSLISVRLYTGRSHQIRVQFASRSYSLFGDRKYGAKDNIKNPMLFSCKLTFPYKDKLQSFEYYPEWAKQQ